MSKKLFMVNATLEFDMLVYAESQEEAERIAEDNKHEEADNGCYDIDVSVYPVRNLDGTVKSFGEEYLVYDRDNSNPSLAEVLVEMEKNDGNG